MYVLILAELKFALAILKEICRTDLVNLVFNPLNAGKPQLQPF